MAFWLQTIKTDHYTHLQHSRPRLWQAILPCRFLG